MKKIAMLLTIFITSKAAAADPKVVKEALQAIDLCLHWGGETAYDEERGQQIDKGVERDCSIAQKKALKAYKKYPDHAELGVAIISLNENGYFPLSEEEENQLRK